MFRRYPLTPDEPPDCDSRFALASDWVGRRLQDTVWVALKMIVLMVVVVVLGFIALLLASEVALVVVVIRLVAAAFREPLPSVATILAALPGLVASIAALIARRRLIAQAHRLHGRLTAVTAVARFLMRPSSRRGSATSQVDISDISDGSTVKIDRDLYDQNSQ
jgi:hypothetical protein